MPPNSPMCAPPRPLMPAMAMRICSLAPRKSPVALVPVMMSEPAATERELFRNERRGGGRGGNVGALGGVARGGWSFYHGGRGGFVFSRLFFGRLARGARDMCFLHSG